MGQHLPNGGVGADYGLACAAVCSWVLEFVMQARFGQTRSKQIHNWVVYYFYCVSGHRRRGLTPYLT